MILSNPFTQDPRVYNESKSLIKAGHKVTVLGWDKRNENHLRGSPSAAFRPPCRCRSFAHQRLSMRMARKGGKGTGRGRSIAQKSSEGRRTAEP